MRITNSTSFVNRFFHKTSKRPIKSRSNPPYCTYKTADLPLAVQVPVQHGGHASPSTSSGGSFRRPSASSRRQSHASSTTSSTGFVPRRRSSVSPTPVQITPPAPAPGISVHPPTNPAPALPDNLSTQAILRAMSSSIVPIIRHEPSTPMMSLKRRLSLVVDETPGEMGQGVTQVDGNYLMPIPNQYQQVADMRSWNDIGWSGGNWLIPT